MLRIGVAWGFLCAGVAVGGGCADPDAEVDLGTGSGAVAVTWTNAVGVAPSGNGLTKTSGTVGWNAGASSVDTLLGDGYVEFTTGEATTHKMAGLSVGDSDQGRSDIDFAIHLKSTGEVGVYEGGVLRGGSFTTYTAGDLLRVEAKAGVVTYSKNGAVFYTSGVAPGAPLGVDTSLNTPGATILDVVLVSTELHWQNLVGVSAAGNDLTKTSGQAGWNAGASSIETLNGDGFVEFTAGESTTNKMAGLGNGDASQHYADIEYALWLKATGIVGIYEGGVLRDNNVGSYIAGDVFRVEAKEGVVTYSMNGGLPFYTSAVAPSFPLRVDTSLNTPGATINDVRLVEDSNACPSYQGNGPVCEGSFTVNNSTDLAEIADCANITGNLTIDAPGMTIIALPVLERIGGDFTIANSSGLQRVRLPELKVVGGTMQAFLASATTGIDLSRLKSVTSLFLSAPGVDHQLACLETAGSISVNGYLPRLRTVTGNLTYRIVAPLLESVGGSTGGPLTAPNLRSIGGTLDYGSQTVVPSLESVGTLLMGASSADFPSLVEVEGALAHGVELTGSRAGQCMPLGGGATALALPALERAGAIAVCSEQLTTVDLSALQAITGPQLGSAGLFIDPAASVGTIDFPELATTKGNVEIVAPASLPLLTLSRGGKLEIHDVFTAPALAEVRGFIVIESTVSTVSLPALASVKAVDANGALALSSLDLPALNTVTGALIGSHVGIDIVDTALSSLSFPALATSNGSLRISGNPSLLSIQFPELSSIGSFLFITSNPILPTCQATDLRDQLFAAGWVGGVTISGNDDDGTCP